MGNAHRIRTLRDGQWCWVATTVVQQVVKEIGFLAFAVYCFLASMADKDQSCFPSQTHIAKCVGCSRSSVGRAIARLKSKNLIAFERTSSSNRYVLLAVSYVTDDAKGTSTTPVSASSVSPRGARQCDTNYLRISKSDASVRHLEKGQKQKPLKGGFSSSLEALANDLAVELGEPEKYEVYLSLAQTYPEHFLREMLARVQQTPRHKIKKNRAAFFMFLVNQHGKKYLQNFGS